MLCAWPFLPVVEEAENLAHTYGRVEKRDHILKVQKRFYTKNQSDSHHVVLLMFRAPPWGNVSVPGRGVWRLYHRLFNHTVRMDRSPNSRSLQSLYANDRIPHLQKDTHTQRYRERLCLVWVGVKSISEYFIPGSIAFWYQYQPYLWSCDEALDGEPLCKFSSIQWAPPKILFEVAVNPMGTWFYVSSLFFFFLCSLCCYLFFSPSIHCCISLASIALPPFWNNHIELYLSASLPIFSTKGALVNTLCLLLLIHNYLASHRRRRCTSLISSLLLTTFTYA